MSEAALHHPVMPMSIASSDFVDVCGLRYHVREWGRRGAPQLFMLHGWLDSSASFQFIVDALKKDWHVIAPDWRGCGMSGWSSGANGYRFIDLVADMDAIIEKYAMASSVNLIGHSMGANVVCHYAGVRPARMRRVISLEGFGPRMRNGDEAPAAAPVRLAQWLDDIRNLRPFTRFATEQEVIAELRRLNPRLSEPRARYLGAHWFQRSETGDFQRLGDPAHKIREPGRYRSEELNAVWGAVTAPVLHVNARDARKPASVAETESAEQFRSRFRAFRDFREEEIDDAGHMIHHDQPEKVAELIEGFIG